MSEVKKINTHFKVILIKETNYWADGELKTAAGEIYTAYLYDAARTINLAELRPSFEMHPMYYVTKNEINDDEQEKLNMELNNNLESSYIHCHYIESLELNHEVFDIGEESHDFDESDNEANYYQLVRKAIENECANRRDWRLSPAKRPSL